MSLGEQTQVFFGLVFLDNSSRCLPALPGWPVRFWVSSEQSLKSLEVASFQNTGKAELRLWGSDGTVWNTGEAELRL